MPNREAELAWGKCESLKAENERKDARIAELRAALKLVVERTESSVWRCPHCGAELICVKAGYHTDTTWACPNARVGSLDWQTHYTMSQRVGDRPPEWIEKLHDDAAAALERTEP